MTFPWARACCVAVAAVASGCALRIGTGGPPPQETAPSSSQAQTTDVPEAGASLEAGAPLEAGADAADAGATATAPPDAGADAGPVVTVTSADGTFTCSHDGAEVQLPFGTGTDAFAWTWDTDHYVIVYVDPTQGDGDIYVATLAADGTVIAPPVPVQSTPAASDLPALLETSQGYLVVWQEGSAGVSIYLHALDATATPVGDGTTIGTLFANQQARPAIAAAPGPAAAVAWMDTFNGIPGVQLAFVDPSSMAVTGPQRVAATDPTQFPWLAGDDQVLGMIWSDLAPSASTTSVYGIDFGSFAPPSLAPSQTTMVPGDPNHDAQLGRMIRTGFGFAAAWEDADSDNGDNQIAAAYLDSMGNPLVSGDVETPHSGDANWPNMAWDGTHLGVVYYQYRQDDDDAHIFMTFLDASGARAATDDLQVSLGTTGSARFPDVAWTGTEYGVMYIDSRDGEPELWMQRIQCVTSSPPSSP